MKFGQPEYLVGGIMLILLALLLWDDDKKKPASGERMLRRDWKTNVPWAKLAREIMWFTGSVLRENKISHYPDITLRYYKHRRWAGVYYGGTQEIVVYLKNHSTVGEFVDTVLHEVCHHIQNKGKNREYRKYSEYNSKYGYHNNPLEVESRQFAREHTAACLAYLEKKQLIY